MAIEITKERIEAFLSYNPESGQFTWTNLPKKSKKSVGEIAGCENKGYTVIWLYGKLWKAHILAWVCVTGEFPTEYIDHINGAPNDNRFINLRLATNLENQHNSKMNINNTSGTRGMVWHKRDKRWQVSFRVNGKVTFFGSFKDKELAEFVAEEVRKELHGEFYKEY